jgi:hypothetical protein
MGTAGMLGAIVTGRLVLPESGKITRKGFGKVIGGTLVGMGSGLAAGELLRWEKRRRLVGEYLNSLPLPPEGNVEVSELLPSELAETINRLEGKVPSQEEADVLLTATAYRAAKFLGESRAEARGYARRIFKIFEEESFRAICHPDGDQDADANSACAEVFSGGKMMACFNFSEKEWQQRAATEVPVRSLVKATAHEIAHMNVHRYEVFLKVCGRPKEDYGVLGQFEVSDRKGFGRGVIVPEGEEIIDDGLLEEEFFAEWAATRFLRGLEEVGLEKLSFVLTGYPEFLEAIFNLDLPGSGWPEWWKGALDFDRVAKRHWENNLWRFHRDIGEVMLSRMHRFLNFGEGDKAALGRLAFEIFAKATDPINELQPLLRVKSKEGMLDL